MHFTRTRRAKAALLLLCGAAGIAVCASVKAAEEPAHPKALDDAIIAAAKRHGVPERLVRRVIMRESKYDPRARNHKYWGLMQISYPTAKSMGFKGTPQELLNPVVNLRYAVPYLANAFIIAGKRDDAAVRLYAAGYYFTARARGLLNVMRTADSRPMNGVPDEPQPILEANASAQPPQSVGVFGALFGPGSQPQPQPQPATYTADASATAQPQAAPAAAPQPASSAPAAGTFNGPKADMVADKSGNMAPPKKWGRDGGMTVIARGEQAIPSRVASDDTGRSRRRSKKNTTFASLEMPASSAQAYASPAGQDPRFAATASQAAIAQATAGPNGFGQAPAEQPAAAPQDPATAQQQAAGQTAQGPQQVASAAAHAPTAAADDDDDKPAKRKRSRRAKHRKHHETQVAESKPSAPELRPTAAQ